MKLLPLTMLAALAGCAGDPKNSNVDATSFCTGAAYDSCRDEHGCLDANCRPFGTLTVCTLSCTGTECPPQDGAAVPCMNNLCQPPMANSCTLAP
jgi:hypothetical protein